MKVQAMQQVAIARMFFENIAKRILHMSKNKKHNLVNIGFFSPLKTFSKKVSTLRGMTPLYIHVLADNVHRTYRKD